MLALFPRRVSGLNFARFLVLAAISSTVACEKVPLMAPAGSTITLTSAVSALSANGTAQIVAQVLESAGTPPHSGTEVTFTTTLGTIQPSTAKTDSSGRVTVDFSAGNANGTANITASSGGASTGSTGGLKILVGSAAVGRVNVGASPSSVSSFGGSSTITANVTDFNGNVLVGTLVFFSTTAGTLSVSSVNTDANGNAQTILTTSQQAVVTASVGAQGSTNTTPTPPPTGGTGTTTPTTGSGQSSGSVTVTVIAAPSLVITPPATASAGLPASFTLAVTVASGGAVVRSLTVDWGDGHSQGLGAVTGTATVSHVYAAAGSYTVTATLVDSSGQTSVQSTSVSVIPVAAPTVNITGSVPSSCTGAGICTVTFQIQVTPPTGVGIQSATIDFGDGTTQGLGGLSGSVSVSHPYAATVHGTKTVVVSVTDTLGTTNQGFTTINLP